MGIVSVEKLFSSIRCSIKSITPADHFFYSRMIIARFNGFIYLMQRSNRQRLYKNQFFPVNSKFVICFLKFQIIVIFAVDREGNDTISFSDDYHNFFLQFFDAGVALNIVPTSVQ